MTRILIVDDDPAIREVLEEGFVEEGFEVALAQDGQEALAQHGACRADLILLDIDMPRVNGYEVLSHLRGNEDLVPVIFLSGRAEPEDQRYGFHLGCNDYVGKPFSFRDLRHRVKAQLSIDFLSQRASRKHAVLPTGCGAFILHGLPRSSPPVGQSPLLAEAPKFT